jgi:hypothetical protein
MIAKTIRIIIVPTFNSDNIYELISAACNCMFSLSSFSRGVPCFELAGSYINSYDLHPQSDKLCYRDQCQKQVDLTILYAIFECRDSFCQFLRLFELRMSRKIQRNMPPK